MTKHKQNNFEYITIEDIGVEGKYATIVVGNPWEFSLHLNDKVIVKYADKEHYRAARVIRRSNTYTKSVNRAWEIVATSNQFPVADHPVQPELPIVPEIVVLKAHIKLLDDVIKQIKEIV